VYSDETKFYVQQSRLKKEINELKSENEKLKELIKTLIHQVEEGKKPVAQPIDRPIIEAGNKDYVCPSCNGVLYNAREGSWLTPWNDLPPSTLWIECPKTGCPTIAWVEVKSKKGSIVGWEEYEPIMPTD